MKIAENRIEIFDTGPGMDGSDENSIVKWYVSAVIYGNFIQTLEDISGNMICFKLKKKWCA